MKTTKIYPIIAIAALAAFLVSVKMCTNKNVPSEETGRRTSVIQIDSESLAESLCDSCRLSGSKLTCSPTLMEKIMQNVDPAALRDVSEQSVTFNKSKGYLEVPATIIANMIDLELLSQPVEQ